MDASRTYEEGTDKMKEITSTISEGAHFSVGVVMGMWKL